MQSNKQFNNFLFHLGLVVFMICKYSLFKCSSLYTNTLCINYAIPVDKITNSIKSPRLRELKVKSEKREKSEKT